MRLFSKLFRTREESPAPSAAVAEDEPEKATEERIPGASLESVLFAFSFYAVPEDFRAHHAAWLRLTDGRTARGRIADVWRATVASLVAPKAPRAIDDLDLAVDVVSRPVGRLVAIRLPAPQREPFAYHIAVPLFGSSERVWFLERSAAAGQALLAAMKPRSHALDAQVRRTDQSTFVDLAVARMQGANFVETTDGRVVMAQVEAWAHVNAIARRHMGRWVAR